MQPSCYDALATYDQVAILMTLASLTNYGSTKADVEFCNASDQPIEKLATQLIIGYSCHRSTTVLRKSPIDILHNVSILLSPSTIPCGAPLAHSPNASGIISSSPYLPIDSPGVILPTAVVLPTMHGSNHPMMTRSKTSTTAPKHYTLTPRPSCHDASTTYDQVAILMTSVSLTNFGNTKADVEFCNASDQPIKELATQLIIGYSCHRVS
ncbi:hypothetical protein QYF36_012981 [Acer negundo]|nr:hypothetical protein QYF36_012981 [Acer negundo]